MSTGSFVSLSFAQATGAGTAEEPDISQSSTSAMEKEADRLVTQRNYAKATPLLQELATRFADTTSPQLLLKLERLLYHLGIGQMEGGKIEEAIETFTKYMEKFPKDNRARYVLALLGDCQRRLENWSDAIAAYERLMAEYQLEYRLSGEVMTKLADSYVAERNWDKAIPLLERVWKEIRDPEARGRAATALAQGYIEKDRVEEIVALLPAIQSRASRARYEAEFNLTLIRGADTQFARKKFPLALMLYQLALTKEELLRYYDWREKQLAELRRTLLQRGEEISRVLDVDEEVQRLKAQREALKEAESYTEELRFRLAQTFFSLGRQWEAFWVFWGLWRDYPQSPNGEQALFAAFTLAGELDLYERAVELGDAYMKDFETGDNYDELTLAFGQLHSKHKEFDKAIAVFKKALEVHPEHAYSEQVTFQIGYCLFQKEEFDRALEIFTGFRGKSSDSLVREASDYWIGLTYMFKKDYKVAHEEFADFLARYLSGDYYEDASFRVGVAAYGMLDFPEARERLNAFTRRFPDSKLVPEAYSFLGDIAGAEGKLAEAVEHYKKVETVTTNQVHIDYASFQIGKILEVKKDWQGTVDFFQRYLRQYELRGLYTEAIWRIGFGKKQLGDVKGMLDEYWAAVKKYGNDPGAIGIDLIIRDWISSYKTATGDEPRAVLEKELADAESGGKRAMALRLRMALSIVDPKLPTPSLKEDDLPFASPAVLVWIGEQTQTQQPVLARKAFLRVLDVYGGTEWTEPAMLQLAELDAKTKEYKKAAEWFARVQEQFPTSDKAGFALKRQGDMLKEQKKYKEAIALYEQVLKVREYRGPLWPECLYQIGQSFLDQGNYREAFAYFQRIYVLYGNYADWVARAYLQSAMCLEKLNQRQDALRTYQEMLTKERLKKLPEYAEAEKRLARLQ
jgi:TolA-binding protein